MTPRTNNKSLSSRLDFYQPAEIMFHHFPVVLLRKPALLINALRQIRHLSHAVSGPMYGNACELEWIRCVIYQCVLDNKLHVIRLGRGVVLLSDLILNRNNGLAITEQWNPGHVSHDLQLSIQQPVLHQAVVLYLDLLVVVNFVFDVLRGLVLELVRDHVNDLMLELLILRSEPILQPSE